MSTPSISVIMPVYHVEAFVGEAIQSVLDQSFEDFELVIVDDGGSDNSIPIARSFDDARIRIVSQPNRGLAGARNTGIANARAPYVALLDSDDRWDRDKLMLHFIHLQANPHIGASYSGSRMIDEDGEVMQVAMRPKLQHIVESDILCRNPVGNGSAPVFRRTALDRAAFRHPDEPHRICWFDESFRQSEDIELWIRLASVHEVRFEGIEGLLTDYRIIKGALSANVVKQYATWTRMLDIAQSNAPKLIDSHGARARAYQLRYLARRAIQLGNAELAKDFFDRALRSKFTILLEEPKKSLTTFAAIMVARTIGPEKFRRIVRPFLKAAA
ncbi:glycosyltransferase family 2 protein [Qipengyuania aquimaris]|uniref:glycosyltransferase family 2 protein n=1 Tax=Qipengyuania aquimaris TaxID=255984 RepID=UPI001C947251|nr:glycosyltransferase family A protein [Qipengyuania aquimaris]MBY6127759.1 glycosyltransferase family 2 protein [Qipengyuania aquimaris]